MKPSRNYPAKLYTLLCALFFLLTSLLFANGPKVHAQDLPLDFDGHYSYIEYDESRKTRLNWEIDVNFGGAAIYAIWIFRMEQADLETDVWDLVDEFVQEIPCSTHGGVEISGGMAHFNPGTHDYIKCYVPSFRDTIQGMIDEGANYYLSAPIQLGTLCTGCIDPWIAADIQLAPSSHQHEYPLVHLQATDEVESELLDGSGYPTFGAQAVLTTVWNQAALRTSMSGWEAPEWSQEFSAYNPQTLWSGMNPERFGHTLTERHDEYPNAWTDSWYGPNASLASYIEDDPGSEDDWLSWGQSIDGPQSRSTYQPYVMSTGEMVLYIGHNPTTGQYFSGSIRSVGADPGCIGLGGK